MPKLLIKFFGAQCLVSLGFQNVKYRFKYILDTHIFGTLGGELYPEWHPSKFQ